MTLNGPRNGSGDAEFSGGKCVPGLVPGSNYIGTDPGMDPGTRRSSEGNVFPDLFRDLITLNRPRDGSGDAEFFGGKCVPGLVPGSNDAEQTPEWIRGRGDLRREMRSRTSAVI